MSRQPSKEGPDYSQLIKMAWPMVASQASVLLMQLADVWMLSKLGLSALASIGPAMAMVLSVATLGTGYLTVVNTLVGQAYGGGHKRRCVQLTWQGVWSALCIGLCILLFIPSAPYLFTLLGHSETIRNFEIAYFEISLIAILPQLVALVFSYYFLAIRRPLLVMVGAIVSVILNLCLNYIFIFGFLGFKGFGFVGAAWGTLLASASHALLMLAFFIWQREARSLNVRKPTVSRPDLIQMCRVGGPAGIQDAVEWGTLGLLLIFLVGKFGDAHLAATSVLIRCLQLVLLPADGIGAALMAMVANAIGAGRHDQAKVVTQLGFRIIASYMTIIAIVFYIFRVPILKAFSDDPLVISIGIQAMICVSLFQIFDAFTITYGHALQGAGDSAWPSMVNLLLSVIVLFGGGLLVVEKAPLLESFGIWSLATLVTGLQALALWARWKFGPWRSIDLRSTDSQISFPDVSELWHQELAKFGKIYQSESKLRKHTSKHVIASAVVGNEKKG